MLRTIMERLARGKAFRRRLPVRFNRTPLYVSPDSQLKYLKPGEQGFELSLLKIIDEYIREDSRVWDIGANVGVFSFAAASVAQKGSTLAVEADIWLARLMSQSLLLKENRGLHMSVLPAAVSDRTGVASFLIANRGRACNSLEGAGGRSQMGGVREKVNVPTLTLDALLEFFFSPTFLKIDVEGAEAMVLNGAKRMLSSIRPTIYIEVGQETNNKVSEIFAYNRYLLFDGSRPAKGQKPMTKCSYNTLALPRELLEKPGE